MKKIVFFLAFAMISICACSQSNIPVTVQGKLLSQVAEKTALADDDIMLIAENNFWRRMKGKNARKYFAPYIVQGPLNYLPLAIGNTINLNTIFVSSVDGKKYFIDPSGNSFDLGGGAGKTYLPGTGINITSNVIENTGDLSNSNEIQSLTLSGTTLNLSKGGGSVTLPTNSYTAGAGIAIGNSAISNTGDLSSTNELQNLSLNNTTLSLSQGGGTFNLAPLMFNMANSDLVANGNHTHNGGGFGLYFENYGNFGYTHPTGAAFFNAKSFSVNSSSSNSIIGQQSNFIQAGDDGQDISTSGQNRLFATQGNSIAADNGDNNLVSFQKKNIITGNNGNTIITENGNNIISSTIGSNVITGNITNVIVTDEGENVIQTSLGGDNIIRNINGGNLMLQCASNSGSLKILPPSSTYDYAGKWLRCTNNDGTVEWQDLPPAPSGGLQAVSVTSPLTGNGTPSSPITMPAFPAQTNFANADLLFTSDRIHNLNGKSLMLQGGTGINFLAQSHHFTGTVSNKFSGPDNQLFSNTANGKNAMFATGGASNYMLVSGTGKNIIQTTASTTKPVGSVLQRKDATSSVEYTDYAMPATVTAADNGKVMTYKSATNEMSLETPAGLALKPFLKYMTNGPASALISGIPQTLKFNVAMFDDLANYNSNTGEITIPVGRYHVALNIKLDKLYNSASPDDNEIYVDVQNSGASNVTINNLGSLYKYIPNSIYANKSSIQYDCIWHVTTPAVLVMRIGSSQNGGLWTINNAQGQSWFTLEKI